MYNNYKYYDWERDQEIKKQAKIQKTTQLENIPKLPENELYFLGPELEEELFDITSTWRLL